ncbi:serine/threonine-protein kinase PrkC [bacterium BMS3Abin03]|nr:serine/threonine-protein kinase PrkC [bacterium BMS3Abin03]
MLEQIRDYKIIKKLGEGGMGTVYLANDEMLDRKVAIKVLNPILTKDSHFTERFRHEAKIQASLIHPNIVTLYNYFYEGDNYCMVMEYVDGIMLKQLISNTGPLPEQRAIWILNQMLEAVGYAHKKGIIHRDIKPSNILIAGDDTVKILDFGIAKILQDKGLTKTGTKMGTIYYMSPEQIKAVKDIDNRTDIYSLGVTFYEMLSGRVPFNVDTDSDFEIMNEIVSGEIKDPRGFYPHISEWVVNVLFASVKKDRNERIADTDEFIKLLLAKQSKTQAFCGTADKTIIDQPPVESESKPGAKTVIASSPVTTPPPIPPKQQKDTPPVSKQPQRLKPLKNKSSNKKYIIFGGIGVLALILIYFLIVPGPAPAPYGPSDPGLNEDSIFIQDNNKNNIEKNNNLENNNHTVQPKRNQQLQTKRRYSTGSKSRSVKRKAAR